MNYFELFDLKQAPSVDRSLLSKKYFELQKKNHPDFFTRAAEDEKERSLDQSADINKAFNIFQDNEKTIEYFLQTVGLIIPGEKYILPPAFLAEMMEINEGFTEDNTSVKKQIEDYENKLYLTIKPIVDSYDSGITSEANLLELKEYYYRKKYLKRILDRLGD